MASRSTPRKQSAPKKIPGATKKPLSSISLPKPSPVAKLVETPKPNVEDTRQRTTMTEREFRLRAELQIRVKYAEFKAAEASLRALMMKAVNLAESAATPSKAKVEKMAEDYKRLAHEVLRKSASIISFAGVSGSYHDFYQYEEQEEEQPLEILEEEEEAQEENDLENPPEEVGEAQPLSESSDPDSVSDEELNSEEERRFQQFLARRNKSKPLYDNGVGVFLSLIHI